MDVWRGALHAASRTVDAGVAAAGAVGGAAVYGVIGGAQGVVSGVQSGLRTGSRSIPAAALAVAAVGTAGLVEWPLLLPVSATLLGVHYLTHRSDGGSARRVASRSGAKGRSGSRASGRPHTAARSRPKRPAQH